MRLRRRELLKAAMAGAAAMEAPRIGRAGRQNRLVFACPYIPMGEYRQPTACRRDLRDVLPGAFAVFHGVRRT